MKKLGLLIVLTSIFISCSKDKSIPADDRVIASQSYEGDLIFTSQADLDTLAGKNLSRLIGNLLISNCTDLSPLEGLNVVRGDIKIGYVDSNNQFQTNPNLESIEGLEYLTIVNGNIQVQSCPMLKSLAGFRGLATIEGDININSNSRLDTLAGGFANLQSFSGGIRIESTNLGEMPEFSNIKEIKNDFTIWGNKRMKNLKGFDQLALVQKSVTISFNNELTSLEGLNSLSSVGQDFTLESNTKLTSVEHLTGFERVVGSFFIINNESLQSLNGMDNLFSVSGPKFYIGVKPSGTSGGNSMLNDFCALQNTLITSRYYKVANNLYNPTKAQLQTSDCSSAGGMIP